jgi:molybdopterin converting factor small subunit
MMCLLHVVTSNYAFDMYKDINPFGVRFPAELREKIEQSATENHRSMNAEVIAQMLAAYKEKNNLVEFSDGELIDELIRRWGRDAVLIRLGKDDKP